jgi:sedoheptulose-bisphosphatase
MHYPLPTISGPEASVIQTILDASAEVATFLRHSPIIVLESTNKFGDTQLQQDVHADDIIEKHLRKNPLIKGFASEERPQLEEFNGEGDGYYVTFDPLDGSSIVVNNFTVGSIFAVWPRTEKKLIGEKIGAQVNAVISLFGPRTTALFYNGPIDKVQELTFIDNKWILSHEHLVIKGKTNIYAPGNLRAS